nr:fibronectin type III domain-containing protein [Nitrosomonas nitrosa]
MLMCESLIKVLPSKSSISMPYLILIIPLLMGLTGCAGEEVGGSASNPELAHADAADEDPTVTMAPTATGVTAQLTWNPPPNFEAAGYDIYYGKRSSEEVSSEEPGSLGEPGSEELSSEEPPSCTRGQKQTVDGPQATITGLDRNTEYVFAIRAFNEDRSESLCSNEITAETTPAQS